MTGTTLPQSSSEAAALLPLYPDALADWPTRHAAAPFYIQGAVSRSFISCAALCLCDV